MLDGASLDVIAPAVAEGRLPISGASSMAAP